MHLDPPVLQGAGDEIGGAVLLHPDFGVGVEVVADGGEVVVVAANGVERGHAGDPGDGDGSKTGDGSKGDGVTLPPARRGAKRGRAIPPAPATVDRVDLRQCTRPRAAAA